MWGMLYEDLRILCDRTHAHGHGRAPEFSLRSPTRGPGLSYWVHFVCDHDAWRDMCVFMACVARSFISRAAACHRRSRVRVWWLAAVPSMHPETTASRRRGRMGRARAAGQEAAEEAVAR